MPIVNVPWIQHTVKDRACTICSLQHIPVAAIHEDQHAYEKQGRFLLGVPPKYELCTARPA